jgi:hypothetical protein
MTLAEVRPGRQTIITDTEDYWRTRVGKMTHNYRGNCLQNRVLFIISILQLAKHLETVWNLTA